MRFNDQFVSLKIQCKKAYSNTELSFWSPQMRISVIDLKLSTSKLRLLSLTVWFLIITLYRYLKMNQNIICNMKKFSMMSFNILLTSDDPVNADSWVSTHLLQTMNQNDFETYFLPLNFEQVLSYYKMNVFINNR